MERKQKSVQSRELEKKRIIDESIKLISHKSYSEFSMRTLAKELDMSATNIYQYFKNRDEILISVLLEIFDVFIAERKAAYDAADNPIDRARNISWAMFYFSISDFAYYDIFYGRRILPKFDEYKSGEISGLMKELEQKQIEMY
ncbi:MAG: TetR/AcrR family transcriptional regulator, partial [Oscillospiraceae bacterium]